MNYVKFVLTIAMDNAAELPRILREVAASIGYDTDASGAVFDYNGNKVGSYSIRKEDYLANKQGTR